jgi:hypothetical protein
VQRPIQARGRDLHLNGVAQLTVLDAVRVDLLGQLAPHGRAEVGCQLAQLQDVGAAAPRRHDGRAVVDGGVDVGELRRLRHRLVPVVPHWLRLGDVVTPRYVPPHLMVRFPLTLHHVPYPILLLVLALVEFLLEVDPVVVLSDVVHYCVIAHAFEDCAAADGAPAVEFSQLLPRGLSSLDDLRVSWLLDLNAVEGHLEVLLQILVCAKAAD